VDVKSRKKSERLPVAVKTVFTIRMVFVCYPLKTIPRLFYSLWIQIRNKVFKGDIMASIAIVQSFRRCNHSYSKTFKNADRTTIQWTKAIESCRTQNILVTRKITTSYQTNILENHSHNTSSLADQRLPNKNRLLLGDYPLLVHSIFICTKPIATSSIRFMSHWWFNNQSNCFNFWSPSDRSSILSGRFWTNPYYLQHVLESIHDEVENVIVLQPTNPLRPKFVKELWEIPKWKSR
jgi:hypothetical protein